MKRLQHIIEYSLICLWLKIMSLFPLNLRCKITASIFNFISRFVQATNRAKISIKKVFPNFSDSQIEAVVKEAWSNLAYVMVETPYLLELSYDEFSKYVTLKGLDNIKTLTEKRAIFFSAHLANWELIGKALRKYNIHPNAVYRALNNRLVGDMINDLRLSHIEGKLFPKGKQGAKQIIKALQNDEPVYMLVDQRMDDGIKVPFLGYDAMTAPAIATLAKKYNCPLVPVQVIRKQDSKFEIIFHPIIDCDDETEKSIMTQVNEMIGDWVKQNPGQWFWLHRRWGKLFTKTK